MAGKGGVADGWENKDTDAGAGESAASDGATPRPDALPLPLSALEDDKLSLAGQRRVASGAPRERVLKQEVVAATRIAAWWRGTRTRRRMHTVEYVDSEGNVRGYTEEVQVTFGEGKPNSNITFEDETEDAMFEREAHRARRKMPRWITRCGLRRVKDDFIGVAPDGVVRWSYMYTVDDVNFMSGRSLQYFSAEGVVRQGVFVVMSHHLVEKFILLCKPSSRNSIGPQGIRLRVSF